MGKVPSANFYVRPTLEVARDLLGMKISTFINGHETSGMIVEVEAYHQKDDEASHSFKGKTSRNEVMFRRGGHCYVYLIYGMYYCVNVVTEEEHLGAAVLIRAIEPIAGVDTMQKRRKLKNADLKGGRKYALTNGPGKVCQALAIDRKLQAEYFPKSEVINISKYKSLVDSEIKYSPRIGISKATHLDWRIHIKDNPWVSRSKCN